MDMTHPELEPPADLPLKRGDKGPGVRRVQEWLCLRGQQVAIDGDFGPATEAAVDAYVQNAGGAVDQGIWELLTQPMSAALSSNHLAPSFRGRATLRERALFYAHVFLAAGAREVGGQNRGPWVRLFMGGRDGEDQRWCAGFVGFCLELGARSLDLALPFKPSASCDTLAARARAAGLWREGGANPRASEGIGPGSIFLVRAPGFDPARPDYVHTGFVQHPHASYFASVEGNSNDAGSSNGDAVVARRRGYGRCDFVAIP